MAVAKANRRRRPLEDAVADQAQSDNTAEGLQRALYLTPTQVADRLLVATVTVRLWATKGWLPSVTTLGGHRRFRAEDVEAFVAQRDQPAAKPRTNPRRVLIIDDDPQFSRFLSGAIAAHVAGVSVDIANDGFSAGIKCESVRPDIVTLDLQMPEMDGFEVCATLRGRFGKVKPKIIALTAFASPGNIERILAAGADACIAKTTSTKRLLLEMGLSRRL